MSVEIMKEIMKEIISDGKATNAELEQVIQRYKKLLNKYEMRLGFGTGLDRTNKKIQELEDVFLYFKEVEKLLDYELEMLEEQSNLDSKIAAAFK